jgi:predicted glutamine amidotransferase
MCRLFGLYANRNVDVRFSFYKADKSFVEQSCKNPSGWGIAWFDGKRWNIYKEPRPLFQSRRAEELIKQAYGRIVVSHVRKATHGGETMENTHPWLYRGWVFAHNGIIDEKKLFDLLKSEYRDLEGSTDSEREITRSCKLTFLHTGCSLCRTQQPLCRSLSPLRS